MKNLPKFILATAVFALIGNVQAQRRSTKVVKGKRGNTVVVQPTKRAPVRARVMARKRVVRTRTVHYHYRNLPRRGAVVKTIHRNAVVINHRGSAYRFHSGIWYQANGAQWRVVRPIRGLRIATLPVGYRRVVVGPKAYFYYYGTYYVQQDNEYEVVDPPLGAEVASLPEGYETVNIEGEDFYELDGAQYMPSVNEDGEEILVVVAVK